jgi:preprotein translocase subunit SecD
MSTLKQLLQDADPLRYEAVPSLDGVLARARVASTRPAAVGARSGDRRQTLALMSASALVAICLWWAGASGWLPLTTSVAAQVRFEVRLAEESPAPGLQVAQVTSTGRLLYLHPELVVGNEDIAQTWVVDSTPRFGVGVRLLPDGASRMHQATASHVGRPVAILLDGVVVMAPTVRSPIDDMAVITGDFTRDEAERIAAGLERR